MKQSGTDDTMHERDRTQIAIIVVSWLTYRQADENVHTSSHEGAFVLFYRA
jgi:hypothetical protein